MRKLVVMVVLIFAVITLINVYSSNPGNEFVPAEAPSLQVSPGQ
ncbi:hypothetical protein [Spirochaeta lutea]|nr:hypothetical protein [Spirochaeta lutea]